MNKLLMLVVLVLLVLASAVGLRNLPANQRVASFRASAPVMVASTSMPVPVLPDNLR